MIKWTKIKKEYLEGVTPKELALKYKIKAKSISEKASKENWTKQKAKICNNLQEITEDRIKNLTNKALNTCETILDDSSAKYQDKLNAAKIIVDISGLKKDKTDLNLNGTKTVFISPEEHKETLEHIKNIVDEQ